MFENKISRAEGLRPYCVGIIFCMVGHSGEDLINMKVYCRRLNGFAEYMKVRFENGIDFEVTEVRLTTFSFIKCRRSTSV
jgi:hypothetical protein